LAPTAGQVTWVEYVGGAGLVWGWAPQVPSNSRLKAGVQEAFPRQGITQFTAATSGAIRATLFTADFSGPINTIVTQTGATAAGTITRCEAGIYEVLDEESNPPILGDLLATTGNLTSGLWDTISTVYTPALTSTFNMVAGVRYAAAAIFVGSTAPTLAASGFSAASTGAHNSALLNPAYSVSLGGQTSLVADASALTFGGNFNAYWFELRP
jgi:hypothetical protein